MLKFSSIIVLVLTLLASSSTAATLVWKDVGTNLPLTITENTKIGGVTVSYLTPSPGKSYYVVQVAAGSGGSTGDVSSTINTLPCANGGVLEFYADLLGAQYTAKGKAYYCPSGTGATAGAGCLRLLTDINDVQIGVDDYEFTGDPGLATDPDGNLAYDNRAWVTDIKNSLIFVNFSALPTGAVSAMFKYTCPAK